MEPRPARLRPAALLLALVVAAACADAGEPAAPTTGAPTTTAAASIVPAGCADVIGTEVSPEAGGTFRFEVTVRSADEGWEKYADAWQVVGPGGEVLGTRELLHPHVEEQPFTRSLGGVAVPDGVDEVTVRARDSVAGWCGAELALALTR